MDQPLLKGKNGEFANRSRICASLNETESPAADAVQSLTCRGFSGLFFSFLWSLSKHLDFFGLLIQYIHWQDAEQCCVVKTVSSVEFVSVKDGRKKKLIGASSLCSLCNFKVQWETSKTSG